MKPAALLLWSSVVSLTSSFCNSIMHLRSVLLYCIDFITCGESGAMHMAMLPRLRLGTYV